MTGSTDSGAASYLRRLPWLTAAIAAGCYALAIGMAVENEARRPSTRQGVDGELIYLPTPQQARLMTLGYSTLAADYYWVRSLQYFTEPSLAAKNYKNLADLLELVIGLDPEFLYAYKFAGFAVPFDSGGFHWHNTKRSTEFLELGVARFPDQWQLHFQLGYNYLNFANRPAEAAEQFAKAAALPGAPTYLNALATRVFAQGGRVERALAFTEEVLQGTPDPEIREVMEKRLDELRVEQELVRLEAAAREFQHKNGRMPRDLDELLAAGTPPPPRGYSLDEKGQAFASGRERLRVYRHALEGDFTVED